MAANGGDVLGIVAVGVAINVVAVAKEHGIQQSFGVMFGGVALFSSLTAVGTFYDWRLARNFAGLFVLGSLLYRGEDFFSWFNLAIMSTKASPTVENPSKGGSAALHSK